MKISNETKVGVLTITALTLLILGFNFLKGKDLFNRSKKLYAVFSDLGTLEKSNEVKINGLPIGKVYNLTEKDIDVSGIVVTINLSRTVHIPKNSIAYISSGLVGSSSIIIEKGDAKEYLEPGDTLMTRLDIGLLSDVKAQLTPTLNKVRSTLDSLSIVFGNVNKMLTSDAKNNIQQTLANLNQASSALSGLMNNQTGSLAQTLNNASSISANLKKNNDTITAVISNAKQITDKFAKLELQPVIDSLQSTVAFLKTAMAKITSTDGTLGALMNDKKLYNQLNNVVLGTEILIDDLRTHPKRYVNFSIFGKKDKYGPLTSPALKDSVPVKGN